jgi:hypothetical protein
MTCRVVITGPGATAIVCTRGERKATCSSCGRRPAELFCSYPLEGHKAGHECSRPLCASCAADDGGGGHLCPGHLRLRNQVREIK